MREETHEHDPVPQDFQVVFRSLVKALQPRGLTPDTERVYWAVLRNVPLVAIRASAHALAHTARFFPTTAEWFQEAGRLSEEHAVGGGSAPTDEPFIAANGSVMPMTTILDHLDHEGLSRSDRAAICKRLDQENQIALMARYGYRWGGV